jgi:ribosomal protein S18 acetylase RimI-like enzyme
MSFGVFDGTLPGPLPPSQKGVGGICFCFGLDPPFAATCTVLVTMHATLHSPTPMTLNIRRAAIEDVDTVAPLFDAYRRFYAQPADLQRARDFLHERLQRGESAILLAELDGRAAGFTQLYSMFSSVRTARIWVLNDLYIDEGARRHGVGKALLDAAAQFAKEQGAAGLVLETTRDNEAARALYRAAGWHEDATQWYSLSFAPSAAP